MQLIVSFDKRTKQGLAKSVLLPAMKTTMAPSSALYSTELGAASDATKVVTQGIIRQVHPEEPLLYLIPDKLKPTYRPLPLFAQASIFLLSTWISAMSTWKHLTFLQPLIILRGWRPVASPALLGAFVAKTLLFSLVLYMSLQDIFLRPSRISTHELRQKFHLPSVISNYETISLEDSNGAGKKVGVHYLKYRGKESTRVDVVVDAVYVHHGFGASSLSWLPALPSLVDRLGARCGLGHDMVGFGFTDRQEELEWYTSDASARISHSILAKETGVDGKPIQSVALLGHSLGAIGVLKMALQLPLEISKVVILSSPALGLAGNFLLEPDGDTILSPLQSLKKRFAALFERFFVFPVGGYVLRRLVGLKNSWRLGLKSAAWGNPDSLKDSDVLRYQWPAIGKGWERGLIKFASAQRRLDDVSLFHRVLELPNTTVAVIVGGKDRIVPPKLTRRFLAHFQSAEVDMIEIEGLGHNAFEEDIDMFMEAVLTIVKSSGGMEPKN